MTTAMKLVKFGTVGVPGERSQCFGVRIAVPEGAPLKQDGHKSIGAVDFLFRCHMGDDVHELAEVLRDAARRLEEVCDQWPNWIGPNDVEPREGRPEAVA